MRNYLSSSENNNSLNLTSIFLIYYYISSSSIHVTRYTYDNCVKHNNTMCVFCQFVCGELFILFVVYVTTDIGIVILLQWFC